MLVVLIEPRHRVAIADVVSFDLTQSIAQGAAETDQGGALALQGGFINGVQTTVYALAAFIYVTEIRGAGVGWAVGMGRIGSIVSPLVGSYLLKATGPHGFFLGFGVTMCLSLLCLASITRHMPKKATIVAVEPALEH